MFSRTMKPLTVIATLLVSGACAFGRAAQFDPPCATEEAEVIARIKVIFIAPAPRTTGFGHVARVRVTRRAKKTNYVRWFSFLVYC